MTLKQPLVLGDPAPTQLLDDLAPGDPVVHLASGVGRFRGLVRMELGGARGEFAEVDYADSGKLYVPVRRIDQLTPYRAAPAERAPLHTLGSDAWSKACARALERARDTAAELLAMQARRRSLSRAPVATDPARMEAFAAGFAHAPTADQQAAIDAVLADLRAPHPMDRVVCGDVGFGKTEVALRAAFAVAEAGRQVAVLVPTTLLAQQHYRRFRERFADWPVGIDVISGFRASRRLEHSLEQLASGQTRIVIGTHKLLQPHVRFHRLGLVVIDEEQRFGVRQKERLKGLRAEVDVLTLTATPIPRTLGMALAGLRDMSVIATPPEQRRPVRTVLARRDPALVREALQRELDRGGQAYVLHNDVESLPSLAAQLRELVPAARVAVAHGQMAKDELKRVMAAFKRGRRDVLVCTTVIETGIDIPRANTIVIDGAERFGLSQLQQLRGRVGRSARQAHAYLLTGEEEAMTDEAAQRLRAFAETEELGAGLALAARDLEIRGTGELLGRRQSGQIRTVGLAMYQRLLAEAVAALRAGREPDLRGALAGAPEIELHVPALIPDTYVDDATLRLSLYQRIAGAADRETLDAVRAEMAGRFGPLPVAAASLLDQARLRLRARALGIEHLEVSGQGGVVVFDAPPALEDPWLDATEDPRRFGLRPPADDAAPPARVAGELLARIERARNGAPHPGGQGEARENRP